MPRAGALSFARAAHCSGSASSNFHRRSTGSKQPLARSLPLGAKATANGRFLWPARRGSCLGLLPVTLHKETDVAAAPQASVLPSGAKATPLGLPLMVAHSFGALSPIFQSRTLLSQLDEASRRSS